MACLEAGDTINTCSIYTHQAKLLTICPSINGERVSEMAKHSGRQPEQSLLLSTNTHAVCIVTDGWVLADALVYDMLSCCQAGSQTMNWSLSVVPLPWTAFWVFASLRNPWNRFFSCDNSMMHDNASIFHCILLSCFQFLFPLFQNAMSFSLWWKSVECLADLELWKNHWENLLW